jgi:hypothetical protein
MLVPPHIRSYLLSILASGIHMKTNLLRESLSCASFMQSYSPVGESDGFVTNGSVVGKLWAQF